MTPAMHLRPRQRASKKAPTSKKISPRTVSKPAKRINSHQTPNSTNMNKVDNASKEEIFFASTKGEYGYLSQSAKTPFTDDDGIEYVSAQQWMMHKKALLFDDKKTAKAILATSNQSDIKKLGRQVANFDEEVWDTYNVTIVCDGNVLKFTRSTKKVGGISLKEKLLSTGDRKLVKASPWNSVWGIGFSAKDAPNTRDAWGRNLLGLCIMQVRKEIRAEEAAKKDETTAANT